MKSWWIAAVLLLAGCGEPPDTPLTVERPAAVTLAHDLAVFGDSLPHAVASELAVTNSVHNGAVGSTTSTDARRKWQAYPDKDRTLLIWTGHNNPREPDTVLADIDAMIPEHGRFIVVGLVVNDAPEEWIGGADRTFKTRINGELARRYPGRFIDAQALLLAHATDSAQDRIDVSHGAIPSTLRDPGNGMHLRRKSGARLVANALRERLVAKGW